MSEDEYTTWRAVCVAAYARDTVKTLRISAVVATERAAAQIEQMIPDGRGTADNYARAMFSSMNSGAGFVLDLRQASGRSSGSRQASMSSIDVPTLVLASRHDGVVAFAHAENAAAVIPGARLVDTEAASHLFWLGPTHDAVRREIDRFLSAAALG